MEQLRKIFLSVIAFVVYLVALPFVLLAHKTKEKLPSVEHIPTKIEEKRRAFRLMFFSIIILIFVIASVSYQKEINEFFSKVKPVKNIEEGSKKYSDLVKGKEGAKEGEDSDSEDSAEKAAALVVDLFDQEAATAKSGKSKPDEKNGGVYQGVGIAPDKEAETTTPGPGGGTAPATVAPPSSTSPPDTTPPKFQGEPTATEFDRTAKYVPSKLPSGPPAIDARVVPPPSPVLEKYPVQLLDVRVSKNMAGEKRVYAEVINKADHPLSNIEVVVKFSNHKKEVIHERRVNALVVSGGLFGDKVEPIKPGEFRQFSVGVEDLPPGWAGGVEAEVHRYE